MELMDMVVTVLIGVGIGFAMLGLYIWVLYQRIRSRVDEMVDRIINEAETDLVGLDIEVDNGVYFCYNNSDKQFICQGTTVAEIRTAFQARFPDKTAYLAAGDPRVVAELETELSKLGINENSTGQ